MFAVMADVSVKSGREDDFLAWVNESNKTLSKFDGFVFRRLYRGTDGSMRIVVKFDTSDQFDAMDSSEERKNTRKQAAEFLNEAPTPVKYNRVAG